MTMDRQLWDLLHAGDWACAHADGAALERVADDVALHVDERLSPIAHLVAVLASQDPAAASRLWGRLAEILRAGDDAGYTDEAA